MAHRQDRLDVIRHRGTAARIEGRKLPFVRKLLQMARRKSCSGPGTGPQTLCKFHRPSDSARVGARFAGCEARLEMPGLEQLRSEVDHRVRCPCELGSWGPHSHRATLNFGGPCLTGYGRQILFSLGTFEGRRVPRECVQCDRLSLRMVWVVRWPWP